MISTDITARLVTHTAVGQTTLTHVTEATKRWYDDPEFDPDVPVLWDLRAATFEPPREDLRRWLEYNRDLINARRAGRKTAWVLPDPESAGFAVEMLTRAEFQHRVRVFHNDLEAAVSWLTSSIR